MAVGPRIVALLVSAFGATAGAAPLPVQNAGFETPAQAANGSFESVTPPGWTLYDPEGLIGADTDFGVWRPVLFSDYFDIAEGLQVGVVFASLSPDTGVLGLRQALPALLTPGTRVSFDVSVGDPTDDSDPLLAGFPGYAVELWAGDALVARDDDTSLVEGQFRASRSTAPIGALHAGLGEALEIRLINRNVAAGAEVDFDAVGVDVALAPLETVAFRVADADGTLAGHFVYDRSESAATQAFDSGDAALTITEATGDLAPFAAIAPGASFLNAAGTVLSVTAESGQQFLQLFFSQSIALDQPLPFASFLAADTDVYIGGLQRFDGAAQGSTVELPEPGAAGAAAGLALLGIALARRGAIPGLSR